MAKVGSATFKRKAFLISLVVHTIPAAYAFLSPVMSVRIEEKEPEPQMYSVHFEKNYAITPRKNVHEQGKVQEHANTSGNASFDLTGEQKAQKVSYEIMLASRIRQYRYYPRLALKLGQEGKPIVKIILDNTGKLVHCSIERSSGTEALDHAALDIVAKAQPFPAPPREYANFLAKKGDNRLVFRAPISFDISRASL